ncbi:MAG: beta-glucosidase [Pseudomonadota bacterium]|nr:beta-glucosidase [Pseudomonadota bacterium]
MNLFDSFFLGGFECSSHRRLDGRQLDVLAATGHDRHAAADFRLLADLGVRSVRDGLRWHLIERTPGRYDWSTFLPTLRAAEATGIQVVWDLCHYGWPEHLDIWSPAFPDRFAAFAAATARIVREETGGVPFYTPVNEISYWAWAAGNEALFQPLGRGRGYELKRQLVRASLSAIQAVRSVERGARIVLTDPVIHVVADVSRPQDREPADAMRRTMFEAWDMIAGRTDPDLGGSPDALDILGVNYYWNNQWALGGAPLGLGHELHRPLHLLLLEVWERYRRPLFLAETGAEAENGPAWLRYVSGEVRQAIGVGAPVQGVCVYPVLDYPGWENDRHCACGLIAAHGPHDWSARRVRPAMAAELAREQEAFEVFFSGGHSVRARDRAAGAW